MLVTGASRSGTTWAGRMLALDPRLFYVYEPFNPDHLQPLCPMRFDQWFKYLDPTLEYPAYRGALSHVFRLQYPFRYNLHPRHGLSFLRRRISCLSSIYHRAAGHSVLMKDPIALLSTEWLADRFDLNVVIMIRHPAGFVGSIKQKGWTFDFTNFTDQPHLLRRYLDPYGDDIKRIVRQETDVIEKGALLWKCLYHVVSLYKERYPGWSYLRLENLARRPLHHFKKLYKDFGLDFTESVRNTIHRYSFGRESENATDGIKRESRSVIKNWKNRLTAEEIDRIRTRTQPVSELFYSDEEW